MYAIIETGGKQYKVAEGETIWVEKLDAKEGDKVKFDQVVFVSGKTPEVGTPLVKGASVEGKVSKQGKGKKITIFRYKPKKGAASKKGHRQPYSRVEITKIVSKNAPKTAAKAAAKKPAAKKPAAKKATTAKKTTAKKAATKKPAAKKPAAKKTTTSKKA